jgi:hypothetical protein
MQGLCKGNVEGGSFSGNFERYANRTVEMEQSFFMQGLRKGNVEGGFFSGNFERYVERAVEMEHLSRCRGSVGEPGGGLPFWGL